jgi:hypothetical protein
VERVVTCDAHDFSTSEENFSAQRRGFRVAEQPSSMREHDGIIKIESLLVKSSDEGEIPEVALRRDDAHLIAQSRQRQHFC